MGVYRKLFTIYSGIHRPRCTPLHYISNNRR
nr:MAG TPA: hypothetical protein [Caudoviricetes sp.]